MDTKNPDTGHVLGHKLGAAVVLFHDAVARRLGLTAADHRAQDIIHRHGPLTAGELAGRMGLTPGAVTALVDRLERTGGVRRTQDPGDRRRVLVSATGTQDPAVAAAFASLSGRMSAVASRYSATEQAAIADFVEHTIEVLTSETQRLSE